MEKEKKYSEEELQMRIDAKNSELYSDIISVEQMGMSQLGNEIKEEVTKHLPITDDKYLYLRELISKVCNWGKSNGFLNSVSKDYWKQIESRNNFLKEILRK